jgi:hypothetical protein
MKTERHLQTCSCRQCQEMELSDVVMGLSVAGGGGAIIWLCLILLFSL